MIFLFTKADKLIVHSSYKVFNWRHAFNYPPHTDAMAMQLDWEVEYLFWNNTPRRIVH
jgi:hypothetical protein